MRTNDFRPLPDLASRTLAGSVVYANDELFGDAGVARLLARHHALPLPELTAKLLEAVTQFGAGAVQRDDITLVLLRRER